MKERYCAGCGFRIEPDDPAETVGNAEYHAGCWEEEEEKMEETNFEEDL